MNIDELAQNKGNLRDRILGITELPFRSIDRMYDSYRSFVRAITLGLKSDYTTHLDEMSETLNLTYLVVDKVYNRELFQNDIIDLIYDNNKLIFFSEGDTFTDFNFLFARKVSELFKFDVEKREIEYLTKIFDEYQNMMVSSNLEEQGTARELHRYGQTLARKYHPEVKLFDTIEHLPIIN